MSTILLRGGWIADGTGTPLRQGNVVISGDCITEVTSSTECSGSQVIDVSGLVVAPGFIDMHTHSDRTIFQNPTAPSKVLQGVTTDVVCNCGIGPFPVEPAQKEALVAYVSTQDGALPAEGITWTDMNGFVKVVEKAKPGINIAPLVAHGALRIAAVGPNDRQATVQELSHMQQMLEMALLQGAWGMSTGLIYPPGSFASTQELVHLAQVLTWHHAVHTTHIRNESVRLQNAVNEAITISKLSGARGHISHLKAIGSPQWGQGLEALRRLVQARLEGVDIWADQYPYEATSTALSALVPDWAHDGGIAALLSRLGDEAVRARLLAAIEQEMAIRGGAARVQIANVQTAVNGCWMGKTIADLAEGRQISPPEAVRQLLLEEGAAVGAVYFSLGEEDLEGIITHPDVAVASDGYAMDSGRDGYKSVHPRSYGTFPRVLGHYVREKKLLTLEQAIRKMTYLPAHILRMTDRGLLRPGYKADITVFDPAVVADKAEFTKPHQYAVGIEQVLINGTWAVRDQKLTGQGRGQVLRKQ